jgi:1-acyl-sn-glycerol-3-phosphate acyltransferase
MYFFYIFLCNAFFISSIFIYIKNFRNYNEFVSFIFKNILYWVGYKVDTSCLENLPTKLILIGSHTSIYDFIIGTLFYYGYLHDRYDSYVLMKNEFEAYCKPFLRYFDKRFKLISIDTSSKKKGVTEQVCTTLKDKNNYLLFIAPEGTRKSTDKLRSGYWYISRNLDIHIVYVGIDFLDRSITLEKPRRAKDKWEDDEELFITTCKKYIPLYPERCYWTRNFYN